MGLSGYVGAAAQDGLLEILAARRLQQQLAQQAAEAKAAQELQQQSLTLRKREGEENRTLRKQEMFQQQGQFDATRRERRNIEGLQQMNIDRQVMDRENAPPPRDPIADHEAKAQIDARYRPRPSGPSAPPAQDWVVRAGQPTPIPRGTAQLGDVPYDEVAVRQKHGASPAEGTDNLAEVGRLARELRNHSGVGAAFGVLDSRMPTLRQSTADAEVLRDALISKLTMENINKMKGVLSDSDIRIIQQASTTLRGQMSDQAAAAELDRLIQIASKVDGATQPQADLATIEYVRDPQSGKLVRKP